MNSPVILILLLSTASFVTSQDAENSTGTAYVDDYGSYSDVFALSDMYDSAYYEEYDGQDDLEEHVGDEYAYELHELTVDDAAAISAEDGMSTNANQTVPEARGDANSDYLLDLIEVGNASVWEDEDEYLYD